jgi:hypothetical protein
MFSLTEKARLFLFVCLLFGQPAAEIVWCVLRVAGSPTSFLPSHDLFPYSRTRKKNTLSHGVLMRCAFFCVFMNRAC